MPELPEVETVIRGLVDDGLIGRRVVQARVGWARAVATPSASRFPSLVKGRRFKEARRRGKLLVFPLSGGYTLLIHLRMTGRIILAPPTHEDPPHMRIRLGLDDGRVFCFCDPRKFGRTWLTREPETVLGTLGPEPLDIKPAVFAERLLSRSRQLKPLMLDQTFIAGLGNIYTDEALWEARLHPLRSSDSLSEDEARCLCKAIKKVVRRGIRNLGTTLGGGITNFQLPDGRKGENREKLAAYRRTGQPCLRCGQNIERLVVGQRSTHICPKCQPLK